MGGALFFWHRDKTGDRIEPQKHHPWRTEYNGATGKSFFFFFFSFFYISFLNDGKAEKQGYFFFWLLFLFSGWDSAFAFGVLIVSMLLEHSMVSLSGRTLFHADRMGR